MVCRLCSREGCGSSRCQALLCLMETDDGEDRYAYEVVMWEVRSHIGSVRLGYVREEMPKPAWLARLEIQAEELAARLRADEDAYNAAMEAEYGSEQ